MFLGGALAVLLASAVLTVRGPTLVVVPLLNWPLPGTCSYKQVFGMGCPGCGLTRCFISLGHGNLEAAWRYSPVGIAMFALVAMQVPYRSWRLSRIWRGLPVAEGTSWQMKSALWILGIMVALLLVQWFIRIQLGDVP